MVVTGNLFPGSKRNMCAAQCRRESRLPAALLEEGCVCSPSQVESWLLSHSLCLSASSKVVAEFVTQESDRNIHSAEVSFPQLLKGVPSLHKTGSVVNKRNNFKGNYSLPVISSFLEGNTAEPLSVLLTASLLSQTSVLLC